MFKINKYLIKKIALFSLLTAGINMAHNPCNAASEVLGETPNCGAVGPASSCPTQHPIEGEKDSDSNPPGLPEEVKKQLAGRDKCLQNQFEGAVKDINRLHPSAMVLDVGAGTGAASKTLKNMGLQVTAVEPDNQDTTFGLSVGNFENVDLFNARVQDLPAALNNTFDCAIVFKFLVPCREHPGFFKRLRELMKSNGIVYLFFVSNEYDYFDWDGRLTSAIRNNFNVSSFQPFKLDLLDGTMLTLSALNPALPENIPPRGMYERFKKQGYLFKID